MLQNGKRIRKNIGNLLNMFSRKILMPTENSTANKIRSGKAVKKSSVPPYVHAKANSMIYELFENSILGVSHAGRKMDDPILQMHRFYVGMNYEGELFGLKMSVKELKDGYNLLYSMEVHDIEIEKTLPVFQPGGGLDRLKKYRTGFQES